MLNADERRFRAIPPIPAIFFNHPFIAPATQPGYTLSSSSRSSQRRVVFSRGDLSRAQAGPQSTQVSRDGVEAGPWRVWFWRDGVEKAFHSVAESLFSVLFPSQCRVCQSPLTHISTLPVCKGCLKRIVPLDGTVCSVCGEKIIGQHFATDAGPVCGACSLVAPRFRQAVAFGAYEGVLRDLLHVFKYQKVKSAAPVLGRLLQQAVSEIKNQEPWLVVPVPLWPGKRRTRGFNQAEEIARAFWRCSSNTSIELYGTLLVRTRETASQTGLTRRQRQANLRGAFAVLKPEKVQGRSVLLVDDVMTTGATAGECSRVLIRAGAKQVYVATVARATREVQSVVSSAAASSRGAVLAATGFESGGTPGHA